MTRRSNRPSKPPIWHTNYILTKKKTTSRNRPHSIANVIDYQSISPTYRSYLTKFSQEREPLSYKEALQDSRWIRAMQDEIQSLENNHTWELVELPKDKRVIGCKWVYKIKYKADGEDDRFKARLVAKGYNKKEGLDYQETFSPIIKMITVRVVISLPAAHHWQIHHMDVFNAFLPGDLNEEVYMKLPQEFVHGGRKG